MRYREDDCIKGVVMVLAVVSDIHANLKAFEAFLEYVKKSKTEKDDWEEQ